MVNRFKPHKCINAECNNLTHGKQCKPCDLISRTSKLTRVEYAREWFLLKKYNIDLEGFEVLWHAFEGKCGICKQPLILPTRSRGQPSNAAVIDHNHETGNVRGLLCGKCNKGIGLLNDDPTLIERALKWVI